MLGKNLKPPQLQIAGKGPDLMMKSSELRIAGDQPKYVRTKKYTTIYVYRYLLSVFMAYAFMGGNP